MDCKEAQAWIVPFIEGKLTVEQNEQFINHVEHCDDCYDELEVYYIVIVSVKQLDEDEHGSVDFNGDLKNYIAQKKKEIERKKSRRARKKAIGVTVVLLLIFMVGFSGFRLYTHPDLSARYARRILNVMNVETDMPEGEKVSFITRNTEDYFTNSSLDMPLRFLSTTEILTETDEDATQEDSTETENSADTGEASLKTE